MKTNNSKEKVRQLEMDRDELKEATKSVYDKFPDYADTVAEIQSYAK